MHTPVLLSLLVFPPMDENFHDTGKEQWKVVKWILRYLKGTSNMCLRFGSGKPQFDGFTDSDMSADVDTGKICDKGASTVQHVGSETGRIDTPGKLQIIR